MIFYIEYEAVTRCIKINKLTHMINLMEICIIHHIDLFIYLNALCHGLNVVNLFIK